MIKNFYSKPKNRTSLLFGFVEFSEMRKCLVLVRLKFVLPKSTLHVINWLYHNKLYFNTIKYYNIRNSAVHLNVGISCIVFFCSREYYVKV